MDDYYDDYYGGYEDEEPNVYHGTYSEDQLKQFKPLPFGKVREIDIYDRNLSSLTSSTGV